MELQMSPVLQANEIIFSKLIALGGQNDTNLAELKLYPYL